MSHAEVWKVLESLIAEFRKRGETIPSEIIEDLRSAKSLIHVLRVDSSHPKDTSQLEVYLDSVEFYLIQKAQEKFGEAFVKQWMERLNEARTKTPEETPVGSTVSKFLPGMPKDTPWVRVKISKDTPQDAVSAIAEECGLSSKLQKDEYLVVYGEEEKLKFFVKKMAEKFRGTRKS